MTYYIDFCIEIKRVVQFVTISNRVALNLAGMDGNELQPIIDAQVLSIGDNPYFYTIESSEQNLAGYFSLTVVGNVATLQYKNYRPQFSTSYTLFDNMIASFISSGDWEFDVLKTN